LRDNLDEPAVTKCSPDDSASPPNLKIPTLAPSRWSLQGYDILRGNKSLIIETLEIANTYDIPFFVKHLPCDIVDSFQNEPFLYYALSAIVGDGFRAKDASTNTLAYAIEQMPFNIEALLSINAPDYLDRLRELHAYRLESARRFRYLLYHSDALRYEEGFDVLRQNYDCQYCEAYKLGMDLPRVRQTVADAILRDFEGQRDEWKYEFLFPAALRAINCRRCAGRLCRIFERVAESRVGQAFFSGKISI
jgi:hypothetical protein